MRRPRTRRTRRESSISKSSTALSFKCSFWSISSSYTINASCQKTLEYLNSLVGRAWEPIKDKPILTLLVLDGFFDDGDNEIIRD